MDKRILGVGLTLLSLALWVGPIVAAFGSHGWSLRQTVFPSEEEMENIQNRVENITGEEDISTDLFYAESYSGTGSSFTLGFSSPFNFHVKVINSPNYLTCEEHDIVIANLQMLEDTVEVGPQENARILNVTLSDQGVSHLKTSHGSELPDFDFSGGPFKFEAAGISVAVSFENASEKGSSGKVGGK